MHEGAHARPLNHGQTGHRGHSKKKGFNKKHNFFKVEQWRLASTSTSSVGPSGNELLAELLTEEYTIEPRTIGNNLESNLPTFTITPFELFQHILNITKPHGSTQRLWARPYVEIHGGVARSVVAADAGVVVNPPSDFDARFYIKPMDNFYHFELSRKIIETFLLEKLKDSPSIGKSNSHIDVNTIRNYYFQKQVVIGGFSLLSIGNSLGKVIDLEFSLTNDQSRKFFDDGTAFVVPLSIDQLTSLQSDDFESFIQAFAMSGSFRDALDSLKSNRLIIRDPSAVTNGLALYAHALCFKGLTPASQRDEISYSTAIANSFADGCADMLLRGDDPLKLVKGFIRSHYAGCPMGAFALSAQVLAEIGTHLRTHSLRPLTAQKIEDVYKYLGKLVGELAVAASEDIGYSETAASSLRLVTDFMIDWTVNGVDGGLDHPVTLADGRCIRLRKKVVACHSLGWRGCLKQAVEHIRESIDRFSGDGEEARQTALTQMVQSLQMKISEPEMYAQPIMFKELEGSIVDIDSENSIANAGCCNLEGEKVTLVDCVQSGQSSATLHNEGILLETESLQKDCGIVGLVAPTSHIDTSISSPEATSYASTEVSFSQQSFEHDAVPSGGGGLFSQTSADWMDSGSCGPDGPVSVGPLGEAECFAWLEEWHRPDIAMNLAEAVGQECISAKDSEAEVGSLEQRQNFSTVHSIPTSLPDTRASCSSRSLRMIERGLSDAGEGCAPPESCGPLDSLENDGVVWGSGGEWKTAGPDSGEERLSLKKGVELGLRLFGKVNSWSNSCMCVSGASEFDDDGDDGDMAACGPLEAPLPHCR